MISPCSKRSCIHAVAELGADDPAFHFVRDTCRSSGRLAVAAYRSLRWGRGLRRKALTRERLLAEALGLLDRDGFEASTIRHLADNLGASRWRSTIMSAASKTFFKALRSISSRRQVSRAATPTGAMEVIEVAPLAIFRPRSGRS
jgi:hypothetical protein